MWSVLDMFDTESQFDSEKALPTRGEPAMANVFVSFYENGLTWIPVWISNYIHCIVLDETTSPFPNFNGCTVEVWEWISNFIHYWLWMWLFIHAGIDVKPMLVKGNGLQCIPEIMFCCVLLSNIFHYPSGLLACY